MPYETRFIIFFLKYDFLNELNVKLNIIHFLGENKKQEIYFQSSRINVLKLKVSIYASLFASGSGCRNVNQCILPTRISRFLSCH